MIGEFRPYYGPVTVVAAWHLIQGISVAVEPQTALISALAQLPPNFAAISLISTAVFAIWAKVTTSKLAPLLVVPQQVVLFVQGFSSFTAILHGQYPDGYMPIPESITASRWFINGDQILILLLVAWHTLEMGMMAVYASKDKKEDAEVLELRERLASYEEPGKWKELIESMNFFDPTHPPRRKE